MSKPKERAVRLTAAEVRAVLSGAKTQMREIVKPQPQVENGNDAAWRDAKADLWRNSRQYARDCSPYAPGQRLWVQETWEWYGRDRGQGPEGGLQYRADMETLSFGDMDQPNARWEEFVAAFRAGKANKWRPSVHMPRWASRITLEVTGVRMEQLQLLSESDVQAEGFNSREDFAMFFSPERWNANPWMWVVEFSVVNL